MHARPDSEERPRHKGALPKSEAGLTRIVAASTDHAAARARLRRLEHARRNACAAELAMPLTVFYGPRRLLAVPLVELFERGAA